MWIAGAIDLRPAIATMALSQRQHQIMTVGGPAYPLAHHCFNDFLQSILCYAIPCGIACAAMKRMLAPINPGINEPSTPPPSETPSILNTALATAAPMM